MSQPYINIITSASAVKELRAAIMDILRATAADAVKLSALDVLRDGTKPQASISNCSFTGNP
jgi:hypothetical protein